MLIEQQGAKLQILSSERILRSNRAQFAVASFWPSQWKQPRRERPGMTLTCARFGIAPFNLWQALFAREFARDCSSISSDPFSVRRQTHLLDQGTIARLAMKKVEGRIRLDQEQQERVPFARSLLEQRQRFVMFAKHAVHFRQREG